MCSFHLRVGEWHSPLQCHGAKVGEKWGVDYYLFVPVIPSASIIQRHRLRAARRTMEDGTEELHDTRRAGADIGIPTMTGKQSAYVTRVKAAVIATQSDSSP